MLNSFILHQQHHHHHPSFLDRGTEARTRTARMAEIFQAISPASCSECPSANAQKCTHRPRAGRAAAGAGKRQQIYANICDNGARRMFALGVNGCVPE